MRGDLQRANYGAELKPLIATSRPRDGAGAERLVRLDLDSDSSLHAFERAVTARIWEITRGARALSTAALLAILVGSFALVMESINIARGLAPTGSFDKVSLSWALAEALDELALGLFFALVCAFGFHILREGAREASTELARISYPHH